jgi:hypothetical protein
VKLEYYAVAHKKTTLQKIEPRNRNPETNSGATNPGFPPFIVSHFGLPVSGFWVLVSIPSRCPFLFTIDRTENGSDDEHNNADGQSQKNNTHQKMKDPGDHSEQPERDLDQEKGDNCANSEFQNLHYVSSI